MLMFEDDLLGVIVVKLFWMRMLFFLNVIVLDVEVIKGRVVSVKVKFFIVVF